MSKLYYRPGESREQRMNRLSQGDVDPGEEMTEITNGHNELNGLQSDIRQSIATGRLANQALLNNQQLAASASQFAVDPIPVQQQVGAMNPQTQQLLQQYGIQGKQPNIKTNTRTSTMTGKTTITYNTTNKTDIKINQPAIPMANGGGNNKRTIESFKAWLNNTFSRQRSEYNAQEREFRRREMSQIRVSNRMMRRIEMAGKSMASRMDPSRITDGMSSSLKSALWMFGGMMLAKFWTPAMKLLAGVESAVRGAFGDSSSNGGRKDGTLITRLKEFIGIDVNSEEGKNMSLLQGIKAAFMGGIEKLIKKIDIWMEDRKIAIKAVKFPDIKGPGGGGGFFGDILSGVFEGVKPVMLSVGTYLGDIIGAAFGGSKGAITAVNRSIQVKSLQSMQNMRRQGLNVDFGDNAGRERGIKYSRNYIRSSDFDMLGNLKGDVSSTLAASRAIVRDLSYADDGKLNIGKVSTALSQLERASKSHGGVPVDLEFLVKLGVPQAKIVSLINTNKLLPKKYKYIQVPNQGNNAEERAWGGLGAYANIANDHSGFGQAFYDAREGISMGVGVGAGIAAASTGAGAIAAPSIGVGAYYATKVTTSVAGAAVGTIGDLLSDDGGKYLWKLVPADDPNNGTGQIGGYVTLYIITPEAFQEIRSYLGLKSDSFDLKSVEMYKFLESVARRNVKSNGHTGPILGNDLGEDDGKLKLLYTQANSVDAQIEALDKQMTGDIGVNNRLQNNTGKAGSAVVAGISKGVYKAGEFITDSWGSRSLAQAPTYDPRIYNESTNSSIIPEADKKWRTEDWGVKAHYIMSRFIQYGWTPVASSGFVGNFTVESQLDPSMINKGDGRAFGLAQWRGSRVNSFITRMGKHVLSSSVDEQIDFANWEMSNRQKGAKIIQNSKTPEEAAKNVLGYFEFSAGYEKAIQAFNASGQKSHIERRVAAAIRAYELYMSKPDALSGVTEKEIFGVAGTPVDGSTIGETIADKVGGALMWAGDKGHTWATGRSADDTYGGLGMDEDLLHKIKMENLTKEQLKFQARGMKGIGAKMEGDMAYLETNGYKVYLNSGAIVDPTNITSDKVLAIQKVNADGTRSSEVIDSNSAKGQAIISQAQMQTEDAFITYEGKGTDSDILTGKDGKPLRFRLPGNHGNVVAITEDRRLRYSVNDMPIYSPSIREAYESVSGFKAEIFISKDAKRLQILYTESLGLPGTGSDIEINSSSELSAAKMKINNKEILKGTTGRTFQDNRPGKSFLDFAGGKTKINPIFNALGVQLTSEILRDISLMLQLVYKSKSGTISDSDVRDLVSLLDPSANIHGVSQKFKYSLKDINNSKVVDGNVDRSKIKGAYGITDKSLKDLQAEYLSKKNDEMFHKIVDKDGTTSVFDGRSGFLVGFYKKGDEKDNKKFVRSNTDMVSSLVTGGGDFSQSSIQARHQTHMRDQHDAKMGKLSTEFIKDTMQDLSTGDFYDKMPGDKSFSEWTRGNYISQYAFASSVEGKNFVYWAGVDASGNVAYIKPHVSKMPDGSYVQNIENNGRIDPDPDRSRIFTSLDQVQQQAYSRSMNKRDYNKLRAEAQSKVTNFLKNGGNAFDGSNYVNSELLRSNKNFMSNYQSNLLKASAIYKAENTMKNDKTAKQTWETNLKKMRSMSVEELLQQEGVRLEGNKLYMNQMLMGTVENGKIKEGRHTDAIKEFVEAEASSDSLAKRHFAAYYGAKMDIEGRMYVKDGDKKIYLNTSKGFGSASNIENLLMDEKGNQIFPNTIKDKSILNKRNLGAERVNIYASEEAFMDKEALLKKYENEIAAKYDTLDVQSKIEENTKLTAGYAAQTYEVNKLIASGKTYEDGMEFKDMTDEQLKRIGTPRALAYLQVRLTEIQNNNILELKKKSAEGSSLISNSIFSAMASNGGYTPYYGPLSHEYVQNQQQTTSGSYGTGATGGGLFSLNPHLRMGQGLKIF